MNAVEARVSTLNVDLLREMAEKLYDDMQDGADMVFAAVMAQLENMMPEAEYVAFCEAMG